MAAPAAAAFLGCPEPVVRPSWPSVRQGALSASLADAYVPPCENPRRAQLRPGAYLDRARGGTRLWR